MFTPFVLEFTEFNAKNPFGYGRVETEGHKIKKITEEVQANKNKAFVKTYEQISN